MRQEAEVKIQAIFYSTWLEALVRDLQVVIWAMGTNLGGQGTQRQRAALFNELLDQK